MRIAFFCDSYLPTRNGVATSAHTTALELRARGHRVVVFAPHYVGHEDDDFDVIRFAAGHWFKARDYPVTYPFVCRVAPRSAWRFRQESFDIVHVHSPFILGNVGAHWAKFHALPLVWTFHTLYHRYVHYSITSPRTSRWYIAWRVRRMLEKCDRVIAPSHAVERMVLRLRPGTPTRVLPTGVDLSKFASDDRATRRELKRRELGFKSDETVLLYVGRMAPEKNLHFLLRSLRPLLHHHNARLLMVGGGPDLETFRAFAHELGIGERTHFVGFVAPDNIADFYAAADVFTFASRTETQGLSIAEALCGGLPCVVVNAMGAAEALEPDGDGFLVPHDEERFRDAVAQLICNLELRQKMSRRARERAPQFSVEKRVDELQTLYEEVIARNARRV